MTSFVRCSTPDCVGVAEKVGDRRPYCSLCSGTGPLLAPEPDRKVSRQPTDSPEMRGVVVADVDGAKRRLNVAIGQFATARNELQGRTASILVGMRIAELITSVRAEGAYQGA